MRCASRPRASPRRRSSRIRALRARAASGFPTAAASVRSRSAPASTTAASWKCSPARSIPAMRSSPARSGSRPNRRTAHRARRRTFRIRSAMAAVIEIKNLSKTYVPGEIEVRALNGVSLAIERGAFVAVMGASGSGKSTLMNILGCLDRPTSGQYLLEGIDVSSLDDEALAAVRGRRIGFVFQSFNLLSRTSALENVELPLFYSAWNKTSEQRAAELLTMLGLAGREQNHPNQLSGGQQQRVAIARALVNDPAIVLADEPTGNLDSKNSNEIMEIISRLNRERGITVIVVTHEPEVAAYTDRVITFRDGVILSDERKQSARAGGAAPSHSAMPAEIKAHPPTTDEAWTFAAMAMTAAARALRRNKMRALLTMLGIFIGVGALIAMVAV